MEATQKKKKTRISLESFGKFQDEKELVKYYSKPTTKVVLQKKEGESS